MKLIFPKLNPWQADCHDDILYGFRTGNRYVIKSGRQRGKNFLINIILIEYAMKYPGCESVLIEPVTSQCKRVLKQIENALAKTGLMKSCNKTDLQIEFKNGSVLTFKSAEQGDSIRGITCSGILIFDEAAFITDDVIDIVLPLVNVNKCPVLYTSTPLFTEGKFYREWMNEDSKHYQYDWRLDRYDMSDYISKEQLEEYKKDYTPMKYLTEILGDFCTEHSFVFGDYTKCIRQPLDMVPVYAGLDFGNGTGNDSTVLVMMNKNKEVVYKWEENQMDPSEQIERLAKIINNAPTLKSVLCEVNSMGEVYFSTIQKKLNNPSILMKWHSTNENKREIIENLILAFRDMTIGILKDPHMEKQLSYFEAKKTKTGYTYENDNPNHHDDCVIALALCYQASKVGNINISFGFSKK